MTLETWTIVKDSATLLIASGTAYFGLKTYARNVRTRRAEFLVDLHKTFFIEEKYRRVRQILDSDSDDAAAVDARNLLIQDEPEDFIEFLNFFELVAYLEHCGNLSIEDVDALLGYYFKLLIHHTKIRDYIRDKLHSDFEHLDALLAKIETPR